MATTISELWDLNGRKPGMKIAKPGWRDTTYLEVMDIRNGQVLGWMYCYSTVRTGGKPGPQICNSYSSKSYDWHLWSPPSPKPVKVKLYAAIIRHTNAANGYKYVRTVGLFRNENEARLSCGEAFVKLQEHPVTTVEEMP